jgi:hypothetical protein
MWSDIKAMSQDLKEVKQDIKEMKQDAFFIYYFMLGFILLRNQYMKMRSQFIILQQNLNLV